MGFWWLSKWVSFQYWWKIVFYLFFPRNEFDFNMDNLFEDVFTLLAFLFSKNFKNQYLKKNKNNFFVTRSSVDWRYQV